MSTSPNWSAKALFTPNPSLRRTPSLSELKGPVEKKRAASAAVKERVAVISELDPGRTLDCRADGVVLEHVAEEDRPHGRPDEGVHEAAVEAVIAESTLQVLEGRDLVDAVPVQEPHVVSDTQRHAAWPSPLQSGADGPPSPEHAFTSFGTQRRALNREDHRHLELASEVWRKCLRRGRQLERIVLSDPRDRME